MSDQRQKQAWLPPRWFIRLAWKTHKGLYRITGGRFGLRRAKGNRWGMMHLTTIGRRSGQERGVILGYFDDGPNLVTMAMNGWSPGEPAWWLNLQAQPQARVEVKGADYPVVGRPAVGEERARLWARWGEIDKDLDAFAARRPTETAVVVLEPETGAA